MASLKIISNPYKKEIRYQQLNEGGSEWVDIDYRTHRGSKLLSKDLTGGFFPFKAKQIVDQIIEDYQSDDSPIEIYFEGSNDEFMELEAICEQENYIKLVKPFRSEIILANARDILPEVIKLFQQMSPLIAQSVINRDKIQRDLDRFTDAASDVVPICVLGNYSSGKSTFINALIGHEILPNGINPVTAKIFKISRSKYKDRAYVRFSYLDQPIVLHLTDTDSYFEDSQLPNDLTNILKKELSGMSGESIVVRMNRAISIINDYESDRDNSGVSDLIEIEIPFVNGVLAQSQHPFVIFDTPGSNSASNARHLKVLKQAMANMTNGLPIFIATPDTLDSTDNENLYKIIRDLDELDSRFTMIVVNKADKNDLNRKESSESEENDILNLAVPRHLYSGGIFYVSSIMGLGSKSNGQFFDDFYDETYEDQERKYINPSNRRYKRLYLYNIMPAQIKMRSDAAAAEQSNLVYANSGLYSVESEIEQFAGKYAAYNKCFQSQMFLNRVIQSTEEEIESQRKYNEGIRKRISDDLDKDKKELIDQIESAAKDEQASYDARYTDYMRDPLAKAEGDFTAEELETAEGMLTEAVESEYEYNEHESNVEKAQSAIGQNWGHGASTTIENIKKNFVKGSFVSLFEDFHDDAKGTIEDWQNDRKAARESKIFLKETRHRVDQEVAKRLLEAVKEKYRAHLLSTYETMDEQSQAYWTNNTEQLREILAQIVFGADEVLTYDRQQELRNIIITYPKITFDVNPAEEIFKQDKFEKKLSIGKLTLWQDDHLNLGKLAKTYNDEVHEAIQRQYQSIEASHRESGHQWIQSLLDEIRSNIVKYNPELSRQAEQIQIMTRYIEELIARQATLKDYTVQLNAMMDWKPTKE